MKFYNTSDLLDGLFKWMKRESWLDHLQGVAGDHLQAYCDLHNLVSLDDAPVKIEQQFGNSITGEKLSNTLYNIILTDFLSRETKDGNVVDRYLKRRGWKEKAIPKAFMKGVRSSVMSLYEVRDVRPGKSLLARDLIRDFNPILVEEMHTTKHLTERQLVAMRIAVIRGNPVIAGRLLPYEPELAKQLIDKIKFQVHGTENLSMERSDWPSKDSGLMTAWASAVTAHLKMSTPMFSEAWLMQSV